MLERFLFQVNVKPLRGSRRTAALVAVVSMQAGSGFIFVAPDSSAIVDVDLSPFSVGSGWSLHPLLAVPIIFGWLFAIILLLLVSPPLAIILGGVTVAAIAVNFAITTKQRLSSSTSGRKSEIISAGQLTQRPSAFDRTFGEIIQTVDCFVRFATEQPRRRAAPARPSEPGRSFTSSLAY